MTLDKVAKAGPSARLDDCRPQDKGSDVMNIDGVETFRGTMSIIQNATIGWRVADMSDGTSPRRV